MTVSYIMLGTVIYTLVHLMAIPSSYGCSFTPPEGAPANASPYINPNFIGYHYETATWQVFYCDHC